MGTLYLDTLHISEPSLIDQPFDWTDCEWNETFSAAKCYPSSLSPTSLLLERDLITSESPTERDPLYF
jgi:hypothetical protein